MIQNLNKENKKVGLTIKYCKTNLITKSKLHQVILHTNPFLPYLWMWKLEHYQNTFERNMLGMNNKTQNKKHIHKGQSSNEKYLKKYILNDVMINGSYATKPSRKNTEKILTEWYLRERRQVEVNNERNGRI